MAGIAPEQDFLLPSQLSSSPGGTGGDDPGYVPGVDLDRWKRYLLPLPGGDPAELVPWTRVTTLTGMLTSQDGLRIWSERNIVRGIGLRSDLRASIASAPGDKEVQDDVIRVAKEVTMDGAAARYGRAVHRAVEDWGTTGQIPNVDPAEELGRDTLAAIQCLLENGIRVRMVERLVAHSVCRYAGRLDALWEVTLPDGQIKLRIGDVKTGADLHKPEKRHPMGAQLGGYVNATHIYDPATRTFVPMPAELDRSVGYILSVRDGVAQLYEIDLVTGWQRMLTAIKLHQDRKASVDMLPVGKHVVIQAPAKRQVCPSDPPTVTPAADPIATMAGAVDAMMAGAQRVGAIVGDAVTQVYAQELATGPSGPIIDNGDGTLTFVKVGAEHAAADVPAPMLVSGDAVALVTSVQAERAPELSPSGRKRRACSKCRRPGHTAKNCPGVPADSQPGDSAVDDGAERKPDAGPVKICPHANGWTCRESDGAWVCADCGRPSEATVEAMRTGGPLPVGVPIQPLPPVLENGATVARLDPAPGQPVDQPPAPVLEEPPAAVPPPWQAAPVTTGPLAPADLMTALQRVTSQEGLGELWKANQATWGPEHTAKAQELVGAGLPVLPPPPPAG